MKQFVVIDFKTGEVLIEMEIKTYNIYCILENLLSWEPCGAPFL